MGSRGTAAVAAAQMQGTFSYTKEPYVEDTQPRKIKSVSFTTMSGLEIMKAAELHVCERNLYEPQDRKPYPNGVLDNHMGTTNKKGECATCMGKLADCPGHFGYIKLELPVYHMGYFKAILLILQCICKNCARLLMRDEERREFLRKFRHPRIEVLQKQRLVKKVAERCKRTKMCHACGDTNGSVKKIPATLKLTHDKFGKDVDAKEGVVQAQLEAAMRGNKEIAAHTHKMQDDLHPVRVLYLFQRMIDEDCELLDLAGRPEDLIVTHLPVPPVAIRPSVIMESAAGSNEDDATMKLTVIVEANNAVRLGLQKGLPMPNLMENWDFLQMQVGLYINSELPGLPLAAHQQTAKPLRGFVQRLKGKQGRFRQNLSGKRVDFSGRTVISPDPNLKITEVAIPMHMAQLLTYPERVSRHNIEKLRQLVINGVGKYPGANFVVYPDGNKWFLKYGDRRRVSAELKFGDVVERHLEDGDFVLFNRQPSLHRMSIMCHQARVMPWKTLRFNESVCNPYNADFDGDEMNLHVPQTEEARTEAYMLMGVERNLCTPKNGDILVAATQDFLTSAFLLTRKDTFYDRAEFALICTYMNDGLTQIDLPSPAILKPVELWTGKQLFSVLVRPSAADRIFVNVAVAEKGYSKEGEAFCKNDGFVLFRNSELLAGQLGKATLGPGNKEGLFSVLYRDYSAHVAAVCMNRLAKLSARWIGNHGFSIGIDDVQPSARLRREKEVAVGAGYEASVAAIRAFTEGRLALQPGCNAAQTLEAQITGALNRIREECGKVCLKELHWRNSPLIMSQCGSKGSPINISQMVACVGQQSVGGKRAPNGFQDRSLPHFPRHDRTPQAKGFVANSFYSGLTPTEFVFHTMGGREGLVDTAVKTAETGYMSRRLMKALEDLFVAYDGSVRNASGGIVQMRYGDDGMDPASMEARDGTPLNLERLLTQSQAFCPPTPGDPVLKPWDLRKLVARLLAAPAFASPSSPPGCSARFRDQLASFLEARINTIERTRRRLGLPLRPPGDASIDEGDVSMGEGEVRSGGGDAMEVEGAPTTSVRSVSIVPLSAEEREEPPWRGGSVPRETAERLAENICGITAKQLKLFLDTCTQRYESKRMEAGTAVGAMGAQSIGEPGTQMTLKTFHFAGVASMNVTLGVPRIKEIINAAKNISTPIVTVKLESDTDVKAARIIKARIEKTSLGEVVSSIKTVFTPRDAFLSIKLDMPRIQALQLDVSAYSVAHSVLGASRLRMKLKPAHVRVVSAEKLLVHAPEPDRSRLLFSLHALRATLPRVIVQGIPTVERAVINNLGKGRYDLLVEGTNFGAVLGVPGVDPYRTRSNHIMEVERVLGIEAARTSIMSEITYTMGQHGMTIDPRHTMLLADVMTYKGEILGITRFGIAKMKESVLMLASFEKTTDHLFDAAVHGRTDQIEGVSECIIMGIPMPIGTGLFKLKQRVDDTRPLPKRPKLLLEDVA